MRCRVKMGLLVFSSTFLVSTSRMPLNKENLRFRGFTIPHQQDYFLRVLAAQRDCTITEVMRDAVDEYIAKQLASV